MKTNKKTSGSSAQPPLCIQNLNVDLSGRHIVSSVDLTINAGEFVALLGPNGAGKTTLFRAILGLIGRGSGGKVRGSISHGRIGYVPQKHEFAWDYPISVQDAVLNGRAGLRGIGRRVRKQDMQATAYALKRSGLWSLRSRPLSQLSGGQRQRVLVARALAVDPELLLLDEPFTGMDYPSIESLSSLLSELVSEGLAILMISHDLPHAVDVCDRVVLFRGSIMHDAKPNQLRSAVPWMDTFSVSSTSPLLRGLGVEREDVQKAEVDA